MSTTKQFPVKPCSDNIIIRRLLIKDVNQKRAEKGKLILADAPAPKNALEREQRETADALRYEVADIEFKNKWDEHPNQGVVMAVGPGRDIGGGTLLKPSVKTGDHILYRGKSGEPLVICKELYWVIKDHDIFCTVPAANLIK
ncbi:MAG: 10 kDa chaperonin [candidate division TM6 bacterium GW2011_GWF2_33_332]|nr:MAG: 10 kDa chaperonin [candidate division TM6 bacterium GW2011_GWF2_33_332]